MTALAVLDLMPRRVSPVAWLAAGFAVLCCATALPVAVRRQKAVASDAAAAKDLILKKITSNSLAHKIDVLELQSNGRVRLFFEALLALHCLQKAFEVFAKIVGCAHVHKANKRRSLFAAIITKFHAEIDGS